MPLDFPRIYLLPTHLRADELRSLEEQIPSLTHNINEAEVILGKISQKQRAKFELRHRKLLTEDLLDLDVDFSPRPKRRAVADPAASNGHDGGAPAPDKSRGKIVKVVKLSWFTESLKWGFVQPIDDYLVYEGHGVENSPSTPPRPAPGSGIISRVVADNAQASPSPSRDPRPSRRIGEQRARGANPPAVLRQTTTEHDAGCRLPPIPGHLHTAYSCQRPTPVRPPNQAFVEQLKKIRKARILIGDEVGVRAYSSSIASLSAYPYTLSSVQEVARLPGCGVKTGVLFKEFKEYGYIEEVRDIESDPKLSTLSIFYDIWGVAGATAREFYTKGWRDLDDVVEYGWKSLSRVQQIGVKYYDELLLKIPRREVEEIGKTILRQANSIHEGFQMVIVGGYRRGKEECGDVDVVLSHPDEEATDGFSERIVGKLEEANYITHTLALSSRNSERGQTPAARKAAEGVKQPGFDSLDKALVVWQEPRWASGAGEKKNPNPHRRVDIIISPWKTAGCAVLGWTGGNTFQRDIRRYCKQERSLKFDSSGIRSRVDGSWVDFESGPDGPAPDLETAERRIFAGLGLEWRPPEERCTG